MVTKKRNAVCDTFAMRLKRMMLAVLLFAASALVCAQPSYAMQPKNGKEYVVVVDPGHGGSDEGGHYAGYEERTINMMVANAMKEELEKYDGVKVLLTRADGQKINLADRAAVAVDNKADFFFCLHFNMGETHQNFGTEAWVSAFGDCYARGYEFADIWVKEMTSLGLYNRGVKTKLGKNGDDYYGVIRHCTEAGIPSCIMEHCHLDRKEDAGNYENDAALRRLGQMDATAVAKYLGLSSSQLGIDYGKTPVEGRLQIAAPNRAVENDTTGPELVDANIGNIDTTHEECAYVSATLEAKDSESAVLYYSYSVDGGKSYTETRRWSTDREHGQSPISLLSSDALREKMSLPVEIEVPYGKDVKLVFRARNTYDQFTDSKVIALGTLAFDGGQKQEAADAKTEAAVPDNTPESAADLPETELDNYRNIASAEEGLLPALVSKDTSSADGDRISETGGVDSFVLIVFACVASAVLVLFLLFSFALMHPKKKKRRRRKKRNGRGGRV